MTEMSCLRRRLAEWPIHFKHKFSSRRADAPELLQELPPRGRGECRMPDAPAASCAHIGSEYAHEYSQRATGNTRHSRTQWFTAYFVISPATGFLATVVMRITSTNLMPASGHQDHTTSPSASKAPSSEAPPTSIASRLAFVTIASRPSVRRDGRIRKGDLPDGESRKFFARGLDTKIAGQPVGQITQVYRTHVRYSPTATKFRRAAK